MAVGTHRVRPGGDATSPPPRHADRKIESDGGFAGEERERFFKRQKSGNEQATAENYQMGLLRVTMTK